MFVFSFLNWLQIGTVQLNTKVSTSSIYVSNIKYLCYSALFFFKFLFQVHINVMSLINRYIAARHDLNQCCFHVLFQQALEVRY